MKLNILQTYPFQVTDSTNPYDRYPNLVQGTYSFTMQLEQERYYTYVAYSLATDTALVSIYDSNSAIVVSSLPLMNEYQNGYPNYLARFQFNNKYALSYQQQNQQFVLWEILK